MATQWNYFFMARWLPSTPQQYLIPFYIFQEISGKLQFNLVKVCPATDETYKKYSFPCFYEIHNTRQLYTQAHTQSHTPPPLIWSAAGPGLFCLPVRARAGCASVADPTPSRGHRPHWPTILRPTNPSKRTCGLSSSQWERERTNTAKSSTFHKKDIIWNGSSWLTIGLKVCVTAEQQDSKMAPYCELFLKSQDNCPFDNFLSSHRSLEEGQERQWNRAEVTETLGSHVTLCLWKAIVVRLCEIVRRRSNTFPPHMRNTVTADCHSFRGQQISTIISQKGNNLWWKVKPEITGSEIWFKKWFSLLKVCCMLWGKEVAMKR